MNWQQWLTGGLQFGLQAPCPLCQRLSRAVFCKDCERQVQACQVRPETRALFTDAQLGLPIWAWGTYTGGLKRAIVQLKYQHQPRIAHCLGEWLARLWVNQCQSAPKCVVVPIPLHCDRQRQRGYNQAQLIAQRFCQITGLPLQATRLIRTRATTAQFGLSVSERHQNLEAAFQTGPVRQYHQPILLLDDIYTTGATIQAATTTLRAAGQVVYGAIALSRAEREPPSSSEREFRARPSR